jgi:large subunit ribosomal protein L15
MVVSKRKKSRKKLGKNRRSGLRRRGAGNRGGVGRAGHGKRAGHKKMRYIHEKRPVGFKKHNTKEINIVNISKLFEKLDSWGEKKEGKLFVDLKKHKIDKLLGSGNATKPVIVKVDSYSKLAKEKITKAGGEVIC